MFFWYRIRDFLKNFSGLAARDKFIKLTIGAALILNLVIWTLLFLKFYPLRRSLVFLHYNIYFGVDLIGNWYQVFIIPLLGFFFIVVNFFLACLFFLREKILSYFLSGSVVLIEVLFLIAAIALILIN